MENDDLNKKFDEPRCQKCILGTIQDLLQRNAELEQLLERYQRALAEADRQNIMMQESGVVKGIQ